MAPDEEVIRSRKNPLFKRLRALKERGVGPERGLCLLEGPKLVEEALAAGVTIEEAAVTRHANSRPATATIVADLRSRGVPVRLLDERLLAALSDAETPQGLIALARRPASEEAGAFDATPLILVAVGVQDPGNLGGLLRTAEAAGATGACLVEGCADPFSWKALRGSMGSAFRLPLVAEPEAGPLLDRLERRGIRLLATAVDGEVPYHEADLAGPVALLFGGEGSGLGEDVARRAAVRVRIPLAPPVESLNVGVAAGLVLFEAARQRGFTHGGGGR